MSVILDDAATILAGGSANFRAWLAQIRKPPSGSTQGLNQAFPGLIRRLNRIEDPLWRKLLKEELQAYVNASQSSDCPVIGRNAGVPTGARHAAVELGIGLRRLRGLVRTRLASGSDSSRKRRRIHLPDVQPFREMLDASVSRKKAAARLGLSPARVDLLAKAGALNLVGKAICTQSLKSLEGSIVGRLSRASEMPHGHVMLGDALRLIVPRSSTGMFIQAIVARQIPAFAIGAAPSIGSLAVRKTDVEAWWHEQQTTARDEYLLVEDAARVLGLKYEVVASLIRAGHLEAHSRVMGRRLATTISQSKVEDFASRFIPLRELAVQAGVAARQSYDWAVAKGIRLIVGPRVDGSRQYIAEYGVHKPPGSGGGQPLAELN